MSTTDSPTPEAEQVKPEAAETAADAKPEQPHPAHAAEAKEDAPAAPSKGKRWAAMALDAVLVLLLLGILAAAGYYFRVTANRYHVPTPAEMLTAEANELDARFNELLPRAQNADTQLHLRARLAQLDGQLANYGSQIAEKKAAIENEKGKVYAAQYAIRKADETNRKVARSLLPGMAVGSVTTTKGEAFQNATLFRVAKRYVDVRFPGGQVRIPMRELVKENLPKLARYAFGEIELVDMSDFEDTGDAAKAAAPREEPKALPSPEAPKRGRVEVSYDPAPGAPVLDTDANRTTTSRVPEGEAPVEGGWEAPGGDLPM